MKAPGNCFAASLLFALLVVTTFPISVGAQEYSPAQKTLDSLATAIATNSDGLTDSLAVRYYDSSAVQPRQVDTALLGAYLANNDFDYDRLRETRSLWDRFSHWLQELLGDVLPGSWGDGFFIFMTEWFPYISVAIAVGLLVWVIARGGIGRPFSRKPAVTGVGEFQEFDEDIDAMDFDALIVSAVDAGNFRRAVRLLYLKTLKDLSDKGMVEIRREKTNADYLREISSPGLRAPFSDVTLLFEYVWYGDIPVDGALFPRLRETFTTFNTMLRSPR